MKSRDIRSSISLRRSTKKRLDMSRAPGQSYDGFLYQMIDMWEEASDQINNAFDRGT